MLSLLQCILGLHFPWTLHAMLLWNVWCLGRQNNQVFVLLKMLSRFWSSSVIWSVCLCERYEVFSCIWHCSEWICLSMYSGNPLYVWLVVVLPYHKHRCLWYGRYIGNLFSVSLFRCLSSLWLSLLSIALFHLCFVSLFLSVTHVFFLFSFLIFLLLIFPFLSLAIPFRFSPGNYSGSGYFSLSFLYSLSLVLFLSFSLCYCSGRWTGECYWRGRKKRVSARRDEMKGCNKISLFQMENGWVSQVCTWIMSMLIVYHYSHYKTAQ